MFQFRILVAGLLLMALSCAEETDRNDPARSHSQASVGHSAPIPSQPANAPGQTIQRVAVGAESAAKKTARPPGERPLPAFSGLTLSGTRLSMSSLIGKRVALFFFNPELKQAGTVADAVEKIAQLRRSHNFELVGIGVGSKLSKVRSFAKEHDFDFPVIDDSNANISSLLRFRVLFSSSERMRRVT